MSGLVRNNYQTVYSTSLKQLLYKLYPKPLIWSDARHVEGSLNTSGETFNVYYHFHILLVTIDSK